MRGAPVGGKNIVNTTFSLHECMICLLDVSIRKVVVRFSWLSTATSQSTKDVE